MFTLAIGGAGSGKSAFAEDWVARLPGRRVYLATMRPFGPEGMARVERHRTLRQGKGFWTLERYTDLGGAEVEPGDNVLLECLGNLAANELYDGEGGGPGAALAGVEALSRRCAHLTVVSNEVCAGGTDYLGDTEQFLREMADLHRALACRADAVVEVSCGLPDFWKGGPGT